MHETVNRGKEIINIWNITPNVHTNSHFEMWAEKWTIMQEASGSSNLTSTIEASPICL